MSFYVWRKKNDKFKKRRFAWGTRFRSAASAKRFAVAGRDRVSKHNPMRPLWKKHLRGDVLIEAGAPAEHKINWYRLRKKLALAARDAGQVWRVNQGYRTYAEQKAFYDAYLAGGTLAAKPGSSNHERGLAADVSDGLGRPVASHHLHLLGKHELHATVTGEPWHVTESGVWG
jgi:hypothetical protein